MTCRELAGCSVHLSVAMILALAVGRQFGIALGLAGFAACLLFTTFAVYTIALMLDPLLARRNGRNEQGNSVSSEQQSSGRTSQPWSNQDHS